MHLLSNERPWNIAYFICSIADVNQITSGFFFEAFSMTSMDCCSLYQTISGWERRKSLSSLNYFVGLCPSRSSSMLFIGQNICFAMQNLLLPTIPDERKTSITHNMNFDTIWVLLVEDGQKMGKENYLLFICWRPFFKNRFHYFWQVFIFPPKAASWPSFQLVEQQWRSAYKKGTPEHRNHVIFVHW